MMAKKDKVTLKETFQIHWRAYKDVSHLCPGVFAVTAIHSIAKAISPYVTVFFSARIINELAGLRQMDELVSLVVTALISIGAMTLVTGLLLRWREVISDQYTYRKYHLFADKMLSMDFADVDNPKTHDLRSQIDQSENWSGWGIMQLYNRWADFVEGCAGIVGAVALTASLFTLQVPAGSSLVWLNHPGFIAVLIGLIAGATVLGPVCNNKSLGYWASVSEEARFGNRVFGAFGFISGEAHRAVDFRIYKQEDIAQHYMRQTDVFSHKGKMGQLARGAMGAWTAAGKSIGSILTGIVYVFVCLKAWAGAFGIGSVTQYVGAVTALSGSVSTLINCIGMLKENVPFMRTTYEFLDIPNSMYQGSLTTEKRSDRQYEVEFKDISFKYPGSDMWALRHVNIKFKVGKRLAIVGENGSGKTTFIKLLCRLYDPQEGQILLNGIDIRKYRYDDYMNIFSVVFQDFQLICQPLGNNVAGSMEYDRDKARKALIDAGFGERLDSMPQGLDTMVYKNLTEGGVDFSGGEAQKIAIARALYKDAPFIILDEPTAALDPIAEAEIYSKFNGIAGDKTAIYISHRLSSCKFCDEIAVFHEGAVIQRGTHDELVADTSGKYYELWHAQAQYYTEKTA
jgi:ATP-binding cassette subfamily B protein